ncbi:MULTISPECIES: Arc family DNA-binding protein [unclassified Pseudomonas]|uniref:Arc family DNA-binding protein n=1 Tax=unclassified Pseudomonas TaxID=196821 RepID=UPI0011A360ED|nr:MULTISPECIES: Arc family DNA-binding protein [unclassified Pseudomonas]
MATFVLRLPDGLRQKIKRAAKANRRSLNGEIIARMERALADISMSELDDEIRFLLIREVLALEHSTVIADARTESD